MQSIHSLSMQLNRSSSQSEMSSGPQSPSTFQESQNQVSSASSTTSKFGRLVSKKATRVKEILLQNLGRADRTTDDLFKVYEENFHKQQVEANKLNKEFKSYLNALKGVQNASGSLNNCISQSTIGFQSARHDLVCDNLTQISHLSEDLTEKLKSQVVANLNECLSQFDELREKIAKRKRKLIDFDSSRRAYEISLATTNRRKLERQQQAVDGYAQAATTQLADEARLLKLWEQHNHCKLMYENINGELHQQLPTMYEKKMKHLLTTLQVYLAFEAQYHSEVGKLMANASDVIDELPIISTTRCQLGSGESKLSDDFNAQVASGSSGVGSSREESSPDDSLNGSPTSDDRRLAMEVEVEADEADEAEEAEEAEEEEDNNNNNTNDNDDDEDDREDDDDDDDDDDNRKNDDHRLNPERSERRRQVKTQQPQVVVARGLATDHLSTRLNELTADSGKESSAARGRVDAGEVVTRIATVRENSSDSPAANCCVPVAAETTRDQKVVEQEKVASRVEGVGGGEAKKERESTKEPKSLYKVRTNFKYMAEDVDELCFEADEIIQVIEFEDAQEQEEGWLVGIRQVNGQRGLFPANFTRPV